MTIDLLPEDTPARTTLNVWPPFPYHHDDHGRPAPKMGEDNDIEKLEHSNRVREVRTLAVYFKFAMGKSLASDAGAIPERLATQLCCAI